MANSKPYPGAIAELSLENYERAKFSMPDIRRLVPKMIQDIIPGRKPKGDSTRGTNMYLKPGDWPEGVAFLDPNNKLEETGKKPKQDKLRPMFLELLRRWLVQRQSSPIVTQPSSDRCIQYSAVSPSGTIDVNPRSVQSELAISVSSPAGSDYPPSVQSVNLSSPVGMMTITDGEEDTARRADNFSFNGKYNHQKVVNECDRVVESLRKMKYAQEWSSSTFEIELLMNALEEYKSQGKENSERWKFLREVRDFTDNYEYGSGASQQQLQHLCLKGYTKFDLVAFDGIYTKGNPSIPDNQLVDFGSHEQFVNKSNDLEKMFEGENLDVLGIQQRKSEDVSQLLHGKDPLMSTTLYPKKPGPVKVLTDNLADEVLDMEEEYVSYASAKAFDMETDSGSAASQFVCSNRLVAMQPKLIFEPDYKVASTNVKRKSFGGSNIPSKIMKMENKAGTSCGNHDIQASEQDTESDSGTVNIPNIPLLQEKVSV